MAVALVAFAGGAYAATHQASGTPAASTFLNDVAKRLNVTPQQLRSAVQGAFFDQLNAAVASGKLTKAQANEIKQRVMNDPNFPLGFGGFGFGRAIGPLGGPFFRPGGPGLGMGPLGGGVVQAAASYLGLSTQQLMSQLTSGKSLAQVASAQHKSTSGLQQALVAAYKARLDKAVAAKRITSAQEQRLLTNFNSRVSQLINRQFGRMRFGGRAFGGGVGPRAFGSGAGPGGLNRLFGPPPPPNGTGFGGAGSGSGLAPGPPAGGAAGSGGPGTPY